MFSVFITWMTVLEGRLILTYIALSFGLFPLLQQQLKLSSIYYAMTMIYYWSHCTSLGYKYNTCTPTRVQTLDAADCRWSTVITMINVLSFFIVVVAVALTSSFFFLACSCQCGGARGVMDNVVRNRHGNPSSKPGRGCLNFTLHKYFWERYEWKYSLSLSLSLSLSSYE